MKKLMRKIWHWIFFFPSAVRFVADGIKGNRSGEYGEHRKKHWIRIAYHDLITELSFRQRFINKIVNEEVDAE